jgi:hypothetical protein
MPDKLDVIWVLVIIAFVPIVYAGNTYNLWINLNFWMLIIAWVFSFSFASALVDSKEELRDKDGGM